MISEEERRRLERFSRKRIEAAVVHIRSAVAAHCSAREEDDVETVLALERTRDEWTLLEEFFRKRPWEQRSSLRIGKLVQEVRELTGRARGNRELNRHLMMKVAHQRYALSRANFKLLQLQKGIAEADDRGGSIFFDDIGPEFNALAGAITARVELVVNSIRKPDNLRSDVLRAEVLAVLLGFQM